MMICKKQLIKLKLYNLTTNTNVKEAYKIRYIFQASCTTGEGIKKIKKILTTILQRNDKKKTKNFK